ncbi:MAG: RagB/SusD family nutrient uptake outer membrane protein [Gemmatimonadaceae bacterium]
MRNSQNVPARRARRLLPRWPRIALAAPLALGAVLAAAVGCNTDRLLNVQTPSRLAEAAFLVPQNAALIVASSVVDFECALGAHIVASGLAAGELADATQTASRWSYDRRDVQAVDAHYSTFSCAAIGVYTPISTARFTNDQALRLLQGWTDQQVANRQALIATAAAYAGYSMLLLAEDFCTAAIDIGPELNTNQMLDTAIARFDVAVTAADGANQPALRNMALVGRARAKLDKGDLAGAAADAAQVPAGFVYNAAAATTADRRNNRVFAQNNQSLAVTVAAAYRALTVGGQPDPRVVITDLNRTAADQVNRLFTQTKYGSLTAPTPIATWVEAQLILAEARAGANPQQAIDILNGLRARAGVGLPPLTAAEQADLKGTIFEERRRELFLQGNRRFDLRRGNLPLVPAAGVIYPKGGAYGDQRCWPLPDAERLANPNLTR